MKIASIVIVVSLSVTSPAVGQHTSPADQEMMNFRQTMSKQVVEAIGKKDAAAWADHYTGTWSAAPCARNLRLSSAATLSQSARRVAKSWIEGLVGNGEGSAPPRR